MKKLAGFLYVLTVVIGVAFLFFGCEWANGFRSITPVLLLGVADLGCVLLARLADG